MSDEADRLWRRYQRIRRAERRWPQLRDHPAWTLRRWDSYEAWARAYGIFDNFEAFMTAFGVRRR